MNNYLYENNYTTYIEHIYGNKRNEYADELLYNEHIADNNYSLSNI